MIETILEKIKSGKEDNTFLYFITRVLKSDVKPLSKVMDKYDYKVYQIDIDDEIREHLVGLTKEQLNYLAKKGKELHEYEVITEDVDQILTYSMKNKAMSFADVVNNKLKSTPPKVTSLEDIITDEELWAYSVGFFNNNEWIYTFRKITPAKVAIDEKDGNKRGKLSKFLRTQFNTRSKKLELIEGQTVNLDKQIDCVFYDEVFYIAKKTLFEQIVGLLDEFKQQAIEVVSALGDTKMIDGLEIVAKQIEDNPTIHKKLVRLSKIGNYKELDIKVIKTMQKTCKKYGEVLKIKNGKLVIEDENDIIVALKVLADYYKVGEVSGKAYGTYAGKQLQTKKDS